MSIYDDTQVPGSEKRNTPIEEYLKEFLTADELNVERRRTTINKPMKEHMLVNSIFGKIKNCKQYRETKTSLYGYEVEKKN